MKVELGTGIECIPRKEPTIDISADIIQKICSLKSGGKRKATSTGNEYIISDMRAISSGEPCH